MGSQAEIDLFDSCVHKSSFQKTPVSMIQELSARRNIPCQFDILDKTDPISNNVFKYRFTFGEGVAVGDGTSKKFSKQEVALNMLKLIRQHYPLFFETEFKPIDYENQVDACNKINENCVISLIKVCAIKNLGEPVYEQIWDEVEKQTRLLTVSCQVAQRIEIATYKTKRQAKNLAAFQMLKKLESMEFQRSLSPVQNDSMKNLEIIEINKYQEKISINATIEKKIDNQAESDSQDGSVHSSSFQKTPISLIHEFSAKNKLSYQFDLLFSSVLTSKKIFRYRLTLGENQTVADGSSKKIAKHQVALNMLKLIRQHNLHLYETEIKQFDLNNQVDVCNKIDKNSVGILANICTNKKLGEPVYELVLEEVDKYTKSFTFSCQVAQMIETAAYKSKRQAKNLAAFQMLEKLESMEFLGSMTPVQEQYNSVKVLEIVENIKSQEKNKINSEMGNPAGIDLQGESAHTSLLKSDAISIIYEYAIKRKAPCQFNLLNNGASVSKKKFKYKLTLGDDQTVADGTSKKSAKHLVALKMLKLIMQHNPCAFKTEFKQIDFENQVDDNNKINENSVGRLSDICTFKNLKKPVYELVREEGEPHTKLYTYSCQVAQMIEIATYKTKRQAKNLTALQMLDKLESMECQGSMNPAQEQYGILENIKINKHQGKQTIKAKMNNTAGIDLQGESADTSLLKSDAISIIYKYAAKTKILCQFNLLNNSASVSKKKFKYKLILGDNQTIADGTSKKSAKHLVALKMLELIRQHNPRFFETEVKQIDFENQVDVCDNIKVNSVGCLSNLCAINNLGEPVYKLVREERENHTKLYTFSCQVAQMIETATYKTKRHAKNLTAFQMLGKLESMEFYRTMNSVQEQYDSMKILENIEIDKNHEKQSINAKMDNPAPTDSKYSGRLYKICKIENPRERDFAAVVGNGDPSQSLYTVS
ncbi:Double-stranded RNA-binding domain [Cinara cedri]|uniref:Double-stranded RNA-binding domain n=1 Tax=Cinara cedri TaxID=506608 RepID=A0A5E4MMN7_9HEMI|nr:Double-stranded RNA-binding domain [Cinara cedri]